MEKITSRDNPLIKYTRLLLTRRGREKENRFVVEGLRMVREVLARPELTDYILVSENLEYQVEELLPPGVRRYRVSEAVIKTVTATQTPSGLLAVCFKPTWDLKHVCQGDKFLLILDNIRDPGNLGTILRTAWGASVDAAFLVKGTVEVYNPKVVRSTMGAILHLPVIEKVDVQDIRGLQELGYRFIMADAGGSVQFYQADYSGKTALIVGGETSGFSDIFKDLPVTKVSIPLRPEVDSLNAAVACGIILYAAWQQRGRL